jgi:integrase
MAKTTPLTATEVKQAKVKDKEYKIADGEGLKLRVRPNGTKTWLLDYFKPYTKKRTTLSLGSYPSISLADARTKRIDARALLAKDIDPKEHRDEIARNEKSAIENTFGIVALEWYELKKTKVKLTTAEHDWKNLDRHILPSLKAVPVHKIKPKLISDILTPVVNKGSLETVKRLCRIINEIMRHAKTLNLIEVNYLSEITKLFPNPKKTSMLTIKPFQLPKLMKALYDSNIYINTKCLVEWQLHTMTRPIEAVSARWEDIDFENNLWVIPEEQMKMKKAHTIPLTPQTLSLLEKIKSLNTDKEYLFPNLRDPKKHASSQSANMALKRIGFAGQLVSHGLRALASTTLNEHGAFDTDVIEAALAHVDKNEVRRAYNRAEYIERRKEMMKWWSNHIQEASTGNFSLAYTNSLTKEM